MEFDTKLVKSKFRTSIGSCTWNRSTRL